MKFYQIKNLILPNIPELLAEIHYLILEGETEVNIRVKEMTEEEYNTLKEFEGY